MKNIEIKDNAHAMLLSAAIHNQIKALERESKKHQTMNRITMVNVIAEEIAILAAIQNQIRNLK